MTEKDAVLITETGEIYQAQAPKGILRNSVCAGSAAAFCDGLAGKMEIEALMSKAEDDISKR